MSTIRELWLNPATGEFYWQLDNWGGFWNGEGGWGDQKRDSIPEGCLLLIKDGQAAPGIESVAYPESAELIERHGKDARRRQLEREYRESYRPPAYWQSDGYRELQTRMREEGLLDE